MVKMRFSSPLPHSVHTAVYLVSLTYIYVICTLREYQLRIPPFLSLNVSSLDLKGRTDVPPTRTILCREDTPSTYPPLQSGAHREGFQILSLFCTPCPRESILLFCSSSTPRSLLWHSLTTILTVTCRHRHRHRLSFSRPTTFFRLTRFRAVVVNPLMGSKKFHMVPGS